MSARRLGLVLLTLLSDGALGGSRVAPGGTASIVWVVDGKPLDGNAYDSPVEAAHFALTHQALCTVVQFSRPAPKVLRMTLPAGVAPRQVTDILARVRNTSSFEKALMAPVSGWSSSASSVDVQLHAAIPEMEELFCHPVFALSTGPFTRAEPRRFAAQLEHPLGRPHLDGLAVQYTDARAAERLLSQRKVYAIVGSAQSHGTPQLFATALMLGPAQHHLKRALESSLQREDIARFFVSPPASSLPGLWPGMTPSPTQTEPAPTPLGSPKTLALYFNSAATHERNIAQRLQVKLQAWGYRLVLKPVTLTELQTQQSSAETVVMRSLVLPPSPLGSVLLWLQLTGEGARIPAFLQKLDTAPGSRADAVLGAAIALQEELSVVPLVTRGVGVTVTPQLHRLTFDVMGLPRVDELFWSKE